MPDTIENAADTIDSRGVIARIEELTESRKPYAAGWNMPGYMPDSEPARFQSFEEAAAYIAEEMARDAEEDPEAEHVANLEAAQSCLANAAGPEYGETIGAYHYWIVEDNGDSSFESPEDAAEHTALVKLAEQAESAPDWIHGETLIRDSYFADYIRELIDDCWPMPKEYKTRANEWPYRHMKMDYEAAAEEAKADYQDVDFDGVTYWIRCV